MVYQASPFPKFQETPSFTNPSELRQQLIKELKPLGWQGLEDDIRVEPNVRYGAQGEEEIAGEFAVTITHPKAEGQSWYGVVKGSPNETLMIKTGEGWGFMRGELKTIGTQGIGEPSREVPFYTGIQSFARRISGAFGEFQQIREATPSKWSVRETVNTLFNRINTQRQPWGGAYQTPTGEAIPGRIGASNLYLSPTDVASPRNVRFHSGTLTGTVVPPPQGTDPNLFVPI